MEGNLDMQYIMGVAQNVASLYWYIGDNNPFLAWILDVAASTSPPQVNSISWGSVEAVKQLHICIFCNPHFK